MTGTQFTVFPPEPTLTASLSADQPVLPDGWRWVKLGDVIALSSEKYQPKEASEYYVGLEHIEKGTGRISERAQVEPISTVKNSFRTGEILYGKLRPYLNKVALAACDGVCSTDILVLRSKETVAARYVHYFMLRDKFVNDMSANSMGVNLPRVPTKYVLGYSFPLPPLAEQQRIVAKIEELFSEIDAGIGEVETALQRLKIYRQAVLNHFLNNPDWERVKLGKFITSIVAGKSFKCEERPPVDSEVGVLKVSAVSWGEYNERESKTCVDADRVIDNYLVNPGDFLFSRANTIELVGACVIVNNVSMPLMLSDKTLRINFDRNQVSQRFVLHYLRSRTGRSEIERQSSGNQESMRNIGQERIRQITIAIPQDLATQTQIVQEIEARLLEADALEKTLRTELQRAERLRQSVLKQAFAGQLLKTDVPASLSA